MAIGLAELVARLGSGIESMPEVSGGVPRIAGTEIAVWTLKQVRRMGSSEADLLRDFPGLRAADLVNAWTYVSAHPDEIEEQIRKNEEAERSSEDGPVEGASHVDHQNAGGLRWRRGSTAPVSQSGSSWRSVTWAPRRHGS